MAGEKKSFDPDIDVMSHYHLLVGVHRDTLLRLSNSSGVAKRSDLEGVSSGNISYLTCSLLDPLPDDTGVDVNTGIDLKAAHLDYRYGPVSIDWFDFRPSSMSTDPHDKDTDTVPFVLGCASLGKGVLHLYRNVLPSTSHTTVGDVAGGGAQAATTSTMPESSSENVMSADGSDGTLIALLAVPSHMTPADVLAFLGAAIEHMTHLRLVHDVSPHRYIALLKFSEPIYADAFVEEFHGRPFSLLEVSGFDVMMKKRNLFTRQ
jgi:BRCA1-associated protein